MSRPTPEFATKLEDLLAEAQDLARLIDLLHVQLYPWEESWGLMAHAANQRRVALQEAYWVLRQERPGHSPTLDDFLADLDKAGNALTADATVAMLALLGDETRRREEYPQ